MGNQAVLNSTQRKKLRGLAHHLKPLVLIGQQGLSDSVVNAIDVALSDHELIKIKFNDFKSSKKEILETIEHRTGCRVVGLLGNIGIIFREHEDPEERQYAI